MFFEDYAKYVVYDKIKMLKARKHKIQGITMADKQDLINRINSKFKK